MPIPQEKKFCGTGILPVLVIFARGLIFKIVLLNWQPLMLV
ncbi:hypothetical protein QUB70_11795 [Microcoleus sp. A003_D6]